MARIALDAMGGDHAPRETVAGAVEASRRGIDVVLVGHHQALQDELSTHGTSLPIVESSDVIGMGDDPARALREKPEASINVAARLVAEGSAEGFVSAGSTGAAMAAAAIRVGRIEGVSRPAIGTVFPTPGTPTLVLDAGANIEVKPEHLAQFGIMGSVAAQALLGLDLPRVGLLSIGEEKGKGRELEKIAYDLLESAPIDFVGNLEGRDIATDRADVIVTDGFTGNVFLKTSEGTARLVVGYLEQGISELSSDVRNQVGGVLARVRDMLDPEAHGGAQLLGVKAVVVIAHGSSTRVAIANALEMAHSGVEADLPGRLAALMA